MAATKVRPRTKPPQERRDELMDAAQRLFLEHGVASTTIEQITTTAGVAKGTFYLYFPSKEHVLAALGERFSQQLGVKLQSAIAAKRAGDWKGKLGAWARTAVAVYLDSMRLHDIVFRESHPHAREDLDSNATLELLRGLLADGAAAGAWPIGDARFTAVFLYSGLHGIVDDVYTKSKRVDRTGLADRMEELCFRTVGLQGRRV
jgi:AcrR family transcriptional regulator